VLGCGNVFFGDDAFGPEVALQLESSYKGLRSPDTYVMDAGTGAREVLFTVALSETRPKKIIVVDAMDLGLKPGEVIAMDIENIRAKEIGDLSFHQLPTSSLLRELKALCNVEVVVIACQLERIPSEVSPGLSPAVQGAIPKAVEKVLEEASCTKSPL
jgi:coenzyme F420 hydrogenase subunit delta